MSEDVEAAIAALAIEPELFSRAQVLSRPSPVPKGPGLYAWHFLSGIPGVPADGCVMPAKGSLLYVGISPSTANSTQNLRKRIAHHYRANAEGSTLRRTLGVLLGAGADVALRRVGSGKRMTFTHIGEQWLDNWMEENAFVAWHEHPQPLADRGGGACPAALPT